MISDLSDDIVSFLIEIIHRLMIKEKVNDDESLQAFHRIDAARAEIRQFLPPNFDPDAELEEVRTERYGNIG